MTIYYPVFRHKNGRQKWTTKMTSVLPEIAIFTPMKFYISNNGKKKNKKFSKTIINNNFS